MARQLVFTNRKGGCGKTTTSVNVAAALAHMGFNVLVVDTDPQAHATMSFGIAQSEIGGDLSDVLSGEATAAEVLTGTYIKRLKVIASSRRVADFERAHARHAEARMWMRDRLGSVMNRFDFTVFDTPPTTQLLTVGALVAAGEAYIPMQAHFLAMEGMIEIVELVDRIRQRYNPRLQVRGIIPTFLEEDAEFSSRLLGELRSRFGEAMMLKAVRYNQALAEAPGDGHTIFQHDLRGPGAIDYYRIALQIRRMDVEGAVRSGRPDGGTRSA